MLAGCLAACASDRGQWRASDYRWWELQRARIAGSAHIRAPQSESVDWWQGRRSQDAGPDAFRGPAPLSVADADVGGSAPAAAPQEPQPAPPRRPPHIDDVEPPRATGSGAAASEGPRPFSPLQQGAADPIELSLAIGIGRFEFRSSGERYDSRTDAVTFRVNAEPLRDGAGVELSGFLTDSTLFAGRTIHDGTSVVKADAQAFGIDMYPHVALQLDEGGPVRVPLRIGAFVDWLQLDHDAGGLDRTWFGFGARAQVLPELRLMERNARSLDLVGRLGGDLGGTWFHESFTTGDDSASTSRFGVEVGIGIRYRTGGLILDAGYRWILRHIGHTDTDLFGNVDGTETRLQELFLGIGGTF